MMSVQQSYNSRNSNVIYMNSNIDNCQYSRAIIVETMPDNVIFILNTNKINYLDFIVIFSFDFQIRTSNLENFNAVNSIYQI